MIGFQIIAMRFTTIHLKQLTKHYKPNKTRAMTRGEILKLYIADLNNLVADSKAKRSRIIDLENELVNEMLLEKREQEAYNAGYNEGANEAATEILNK